MRDAHRIRDILEKIDLVWKRYPDWRFGQLLWNIGYLRSEYAFPDDPYYIEDDELEALLDKYITKMGPYKGP
jgi:hypothetical protein